MTEPVVGIIMGSSSDWETMRHAADTLEQLGIANDLWEAAQKIVKLTGKAA